ncbi:Tim50p [Lipomyces japonicus]|uniref:Tim50p n=1 Tax=Lipomyces japonicus TaxID=56871 RepID=UPI0034CF3266
MMSLATASRAIGRQIVIRTVEHCTSPILLRTKSNLFLSRVTLNRTFASKSGNNEFLGAENDNKTKTENSQAGIKQDISTESLGLKDLVNDLDKEYADSKKEKINSGAQEPNSTAGETEGLGTGSKPEWAGTAKRADYQAATDARRTRRLVLSLSLVSVLAIASGLYLGRDWEPEEQKVHRDIPNGYSPDLVYNRFKERLSGIFSFYTGPAFEPELPPVPEEYRRPLTLILGLEDVLTHSEWTMKDGWKTYKRPGLDYFLGYLSQYYEIVIFSSDYASNAERIIMKLDPYHAYISGALFRESTHYVEGKVVKDISKLNRDLSKVVTIDSEPAAFSRQPENTIPLTKWTGDKSDTELVELIPLLEFFATSDVKDVRTVLKTFEDSNNYIEEYARREQQLRERLIRNWENKKQRSGIVGFVLNYFGVQSKTEKPVLMIDLIRQEGIKNYENMQKFIAENGEKILAEEKERERQLLAEQNFTLGKALTSLDPSAQQSQNN